MKNKPKKWSPWSNKEDQKLAKIVKANSSNLNSAFEKASKSLGRTLSSCTSRWYFIRNNKNVSAFNTKANGVALTNIKNTPSPKRSKIITTKLPKYQLYVENGTAHLPGGIVIKGNFYL